MSYSTSLLQGLADHFDDEGGWAEDLACFMCTMNRPSDVLYWAGYTAAMYDACTHIRRVLELIEEDARMFQHDGGDAA